MRHNVPSFFCALIAHSQHFFGIRTRNVVLVFSTREAAFEALHRYRRPLISNTDWNLATILTRDQAVTNTNSPHPRGFPTLVLDEKLSLDFQAHGCIFVLRSNY